MSVERQCDEYLRHFRGLADSLRGGQGPDDLRAAFETMVSKAPVVDVTSALLELVSQGIRRENIRLLIEWYRETGALPTCHVASLAGGPDHPVAAFRRENAALRSCVARYRDMMRCIYEVSESLGHDEIGLENLWEVDKHYRRQEFLLFTRLERHGLVRPGRILWAAHDEIRQWLKYLDLQFASDDFEVDGLAAMRDSVIGPLLDDLEWMILLEECLLLPLAFETLEQVDWDIILRHSAKIGWCLVEPVSADQPDLLSAGSVLPSEELKISLPTGVLSPELLALLHHQLPVDLTFVDAEDHICYFSEGSPPVFYRSEAILGREIRCCHPPRSVHYVDQILADFKSGEQSSAQFWKYIGDRFIHIRFVALRDDKKNYVGTLEIAQDITNLRALEGQRLELRYD